MRFGIILEKLRDRHERSGNVVQWNVGIKALILLNTLYISVSNARLYTGLNSSPLTFDLDI